jgi:hypothetical protein
MMNLWILLFAVGLRASSASSSLRGEAVEADFDVTSLRQSNPETNFQRRLWEETLSNAVDFNCTIAEFPVCCQVMGNNTKLYTPKNHFAPADNNVGFKEPHGAQARSCKRTRVYEPSPYEMAHLKLAKELGTITNYNERRDRFYNMIKEDLDDSILWIERVDYHMRHANDVTIGLRADPLDLKYLSRFNNTITCHDGNSHTWIEWIEPITIHARHPVSMIEHCHPPHMKNLRKEVMSKIKVHTAHINIVDHIILESNRDYHLKKLWHHHSKEVQPKRFFFDAGTSYFYSSLAWFTCAYGQVSITIARTFPLHSLLIVVFVLSFVCA